MAVTSPFTTPEELEAGLSDLDDTGAHYQVVVRASFASYLTHWLLDAVAEYRIPS